MKYRKLNIGEQFKTGDEMRNPNTGIWEPIPQQWVTTKCKYEMIGTIKNFHIIMRRKTEERQTSFNKQRDAITHDALVDTVGEEDAAYFEAAGIDDIGCKD
jgi:hypothetical protein